MSKLALLLIMSVLSGILYHIAGKGGFKGAKLIRRVLCPLLALGLFFALKTPQIRHVWAYVAFLGLNYGALSTYHDYIGYDCWLLTGLFYGLAALPLLWCGIHLWVIIIRAIFLALSIWWLRSKTGKVEIEEIGSGFLYTATIPLLLI